MAAEGVTSAVNESIKEAVLAAVREELAAHKEEVDELRHMLTAVKGELADVKGELAKHTEKLAESSGASDASGLGGKSRKRTHDMRDMRLESAAEEERTEVQELTACKDKYRIQYLKLNAELEISQAIESATKKNNLDLRFDHGLADAALHLVSTRTDLMGVNLSSALSFSAEGIKHLYKLPRLAELDLDGTVVSDCALEGIGSLTRLDSLFLHRAKVTVAGLRHLTALSSLNRLWLSGCKGVTNAGMVHVGRLTGLQELVLNRTTVTDDGLQHLTALSSLKVLHLSDCQGVTDAGMVHVGKLTGLEGLHLVGTAVTDDGLQQLTALTKLRSLWPAEGDCLVDIEVVWRLGRCRQ